MARTTQPDPRARRRTQVVGRSGELTVISELLLRGWIPARPEIDMGDDAIILDDVGTVWRIQIKSATAVIGHGGRGHRAQFGLRLDQLQAAFTPDLCYVFAVRIDDRWTRFVVISRDELRSEHELHGVGTAHEGRLTVNLYVRSNGTVTAGTSHGDTQRDWSQYLDRWPLAA